MRVLITGANGFIGKNLTAQLNNLSASDNAALYEILKVTRNTSDDELDKLCEQCECVIHLAGINRSQNPNDFTDGNVVFLEKLLNSLEKHNNKSPVLMSSSRQAALEGQFADSVYGKSKRQAENILKAYAEKNNINAYIYRLPNVFGKWCKPNYNSVIATFCNNIANGLPIQINDENAQIDFVYIDDVVKEFINTVKDGLNHGRADNDKSAKNKIDDMSDGYYCEVVPVYPMKVGKIAELIQEFHSNRANLNISDMTDDSFAKKLYATYLTYLPRDAFSYPLDMHVDSRGSFTEIIRTIDRGQFSVNVAKPGITKGNHWHHTKNEKFLVVSGKAKIAFRKIDEDEVIEYNVSSDKLEVVDIPPGYTHNIKNTGSVDLITFMWCNECFNPENPDTYPLDV